MSPDIQTFLPTILLCLVVLAVMVYVPNIRGEDETGRHPVFEKRCMARYGFWAGNYFARISLYDDFMIVRRMDSLKINYGSIRSVRETFSFVGGCLIIDSAELEKKLWIYTLFRTEKLLSVLQGKSVHAG